MKKSVVCLVHRRAYSGKTCPGCVASAKRRSKDTPGRRFAKQFREEFEAIHGQQKWKIAL